MDIHIEIYLLSKEREAHELILCITLQTFTILVTGGKNMKRIKKASIIICVVIMLVSALAVPVSAASNDRYHTFE